MHFVLNLSIVQGVNNWFLDNLYRQVLNFIVHPVN